MQHAALDLLAKLTRVQQSRQEGKQRQARSQTLVLFLIAMITGSSTNSSLDSHHASSACASATAEVVLYWSLDDVMLPKQHEYSSSGQRAAYLDAWHHASAPQKSSQTLR